MTRGVRERETGRSPSIGLRGRPHAHASLDESRPDGSRVDVEPCGHGGEGLAGGVEACGFVGLLLGEPGSSH